ncbi:hypothetical protein ACJJTC_017238 [Scirpophaga incertulas]
MLDKGTVGSGGKKLDNEVTFINEAKRAASCKEIRTSSAWRKFNETEITRGDLRCAYLKRFMLEGVEAVNKDSADINNYEPQLGTNDRNEHVRRCQISKEFAELAHIVDKWNWISNY